MISLLKTSSVVVILKLRQHISNFGLSRLFYISEFSAANIFITWVNYMSLQWHELNMWPSRDLVRYFMPEDFRRKFSNTRVILDGMECPMMKRKCPRAQQATFYTYKNRNTLQVVVGGSPGGLLSRIPAAYGGSASDRQLVEHSDLSQKCSSNDSLMGFNVQDIFAPYNVGINIPTFMTKKTNYQE